MFNTICNQKSFDPMQVAADAEDKSFIARPCCIEAMNNIWFDKLDPEQKRKRDILALIVGFLTLGLAAPLIVKYRKPESVRIVFC